MTQEELLKVYLAEGYDKKYFPLFYEEWKENLEYSDEEDEQLATEQSFQFMETFALQVSLGYSAGWARQYALAKEQIDYPHNVLEIINEFYSISEEDLDLFAKSQHNGELFEKVLKLAWLRDDDEYRTEGLVYDYAIDYVKQYNEILAEGHTETYAKAYLAFETEKDSCISPKLYAQMIDDAVKKGMPIKEAEKFARDAAFIGIYNDDTIDSTPAYLKEYCEEWQRKYIIQCVAYILACREQLCHEEDFVKLFVSEMHNIEDLANVKEDDLYVANHRALDEYYVEHYKEMPHDWEPYYDGEFEGMEDPML
jgi:hypothetical protein